MSGKWLELLKEIAPGVTRAAVLRDATNPAGIGQFAAIQSVAPSLGVEVSPVDVRDAARSSAPLTAFARSPNGGLIVTASGLRDSAARSDHHACGPTRLPAVYPFRFFVTDGGLISYGPRFDRPVPARGRLRRPHSQGREASRPAGAGADQVRAGRSTSRPPRRSASTCRHRCSPAPTR